MRLSELKLTVEYIEDILRIKNQLHNTSDKENYKLGLIKYNITKNILIAKSLYQLFEYITALNRIV